ncbi:unnamed protein product [Schistosoma margrebowiei]|uniref:Uncharacterized protein n=1 Tax=Schistosoma margrebowiei TaxID=48269 RepID=A0A183LDX9_9TREM|nr:unnamed protein product [Schistosoma margrebowiei]
MTEKAVRRENMRGHHDTTKTSTVKFRRPERQFQDNKSFTIYEIQQHNNKCGIQFEELFNTLDTLNTSNIEATHTDLPIDSAASIII